MSGVAFCNGGDYLTSIPVIMEIRNNVPRLMGSSSPIDLVVCQQVVWIYINGKKYPLCLVP